MIGVGARRNQLLSCNSTHWLRSPLEAAMDPTLEVLRAIREQMDALDDPEGAVVAVVLDFALLQAPQAESEAVS